jgi:hypothetical protein
LASLPAPRAGRQGRAPLLRACATGRRRHCAGVQPASCSDADLDIDRASAYARGHTEAPCDASPAALAGRSEPRRPGPGCDLSRGDCRERRGQSDPRTVSPGRYFDVIESRTQREASGEWVVLGTVRNHCDRRLPARVHAEAQDGRQQRIAGGEQRLAELNASEQRQFRIVLGTLGAAPSQVVVGATLP